MYFRPPRTLFFGDNFLLFGAIGFKFSHGPFQLTPYFLSIYFLYKNNNLGGLSLTRNGS